MNLLPSCQKKLEDISDHIISYVDGRDSVVIGTTYKDLKEIVKKIVDSGYFVNRGAVVEEDLTSKTGSGMSPKGVQFIATVFTCLPDIF